MFKTLTGISFEIFAESGKIFPSTLLFIATVRSGIEKTAQIVVESCLFLRLDLYQEDFQFPVE